MRTFVGIQEAATASEFEELAYGFAADQPLPEFFRELLLGPEHSEDEQERAARLDAARGILGDLLDDEPVLLAYAVALMDAVPLAHRRAGRRSTVLKAAA